MNCTVVAGMLLSVATRGANCPSAAAGGEGWEQVYSEGVACHRNDSAALRFFDAMAAEQHEAWASRLYCTCTALQLCAMRESDLSAWAGVLVGNSLVFVCSAVMALSMGALVALRVSHQCRGSAPDAGFSGWCAGAGIARWLRSDGMARASPWPAAHPSHCFLSRVRRLLSLWVGGWVHG